MTPEPHNTDGIRRLRVLLISHRDLFEGEHRTQSAFCRALAATVDLSFGAWEDGSTDSPRFSEFAELATARTTAADFDACVFFVRFRLLSRAAAFDWESFSGLRVMYDEDAWHNFPVGSPGPFSGAWPPVYRRHGFDTLVCTGREVARRLCAQGVEARWVPKGYDAARFADLGRPRKGLCTFGQPWPSRRALAERLRREHIPMRDVSGPFASLNERLNEHAGAVVCNMGAVVPLGRLGRRTQRRWPRLARLVAGIEPMIKTFEVAGAGCAPIIDWIDELDELGFVADENCVIYRDLDDLVDQLSRLDDDALVEIGHRAHALAAGNHTWSHRAQEFSKLLRELVAVRRE